MRFEDRDYYRDASDPAPGIPGFRFNQQSMVTNLIVINVVFFLADMFTPKLADLGGTQWLSFQMALKSGQWWQVWTFLSHGFAHASVTTQTGIFHLIFNMLTLFFLGQPVEQRLGRIEFLKFYLMAVVVGGVAWYLSVTLSGGGGFCVGASGAVSAVVICFIFMAPQARLLMFGVIPMPAWVVGVLFLLMNLSYAFRSSQIAWEAHLAGGAFGMLYYQMKWSFAKLKMPRGTKVKVHHPEDGDDKLQSEADRILAKIAESGEASLTGKERRTLKK